MLAFIDLSFSFALMLAASIHTADNNPNLFGNLLSTMLVMTLLTRNCKWACYITIPLVTMATALSVALIYVFLEDLQKGFILHDNIMLANVPMYASIMLTQVGYTSWRIFR